MAMYRGEETENLCGSLSAAFREFVTSNGLVFSRCDGFRVVVENQYVKFVLENFDDEFVRFDFFDKQCDPEKALNPKIYLDVVLGHENELRRKGLFHDQHGHEKFEASLAYHTYLIMHCFGAAIEGERSWLLQYEGRVAYLARMDAFFKQLGIAGDPRMDSIYDKKSALDPAWEDDARALYKEIHGKDFE